MPSIMEFMQGISDLKNNMSVAYAEVKKTTAVLYRDYPNNYSRVMMDHKELCMQYECMLHILERIQQEIQDKIRTEQHLNDHEEIEAYLGSYPRNIGENGTIFKDKKLKLPSTAALVYSPKGELKFILTRNSKDKGKAIPDKENFNPRGMSKSVKYGSVYELDAWPPIQKVKVTVADTGRFKHEQKMLKKIGGSDFAIIQNFGTTYEKSIDDTPYIVGFAERAKCDLLYGDIRNINNRELYLLFAELIYKLKNMHEKNIVHRDIKLDNILINDNNIPEYIDYEMALDLNEELPESIAVTPLYSSPRCILRTCIECSDRSLKEIFSSADYFNKSIKGFMKFIAEKSQLESEEIEFHTNIITSKNINEWQRILESKDDPKKCDVWALGISLYYYQYRKTPTKTYENVVKNDPILRLWLSIDEDSRPTAEELLIIWSANYVAKKFDVNEGFDRLNQDLKLVGGVQGLIKLIRQDMLQKNSLNPEGLNLLEIKHDIYKSALNKIESNFHLSAVNSINTGNSDTLNSSKALISLEDEFIHEICLENDTSDSEVSKNVTLLEQLKRDQQHKVPLLHIYSNKKNTNNNYSSIPIQENFAHASKETCINGCRLS